jgi:hypothetical protein
MRWLCKKDTELLFSSQLRGLTVTQLIASYYKKQIIPRNGGWFLRDKGDQDGSSSIAFSNSPLSVEHRSL